MKKALCSALLVLALASCRREEELERPWTSELREAHALADRAKDDTAKKDALLHLAKVYETSPKGKGAAPLRLDLAARSARIARGLGDYSLAESWAKRGLAEKTDTPLLTAQLHIELAETLLHTDRKIEAKENLLEAIELNEKILLKELETP